jgi:very-short-patch-repair endonuclease
MRSSILTSKRAEALRQALTAPELILWTRLKRRSPEWPVFRNQHPLGPYILDFFCPAAKLDVEIDGAIHGEEAQIAHDARRDSWLERQGITVYRVPASSVFHHPDEVADGVRRFARDLASARAAAPSTNRSSAVGPPPPSSSRQGRRN